MPEKRIRGAETFIRLVQDGKLATDTWKAISDFTFTDEHEVLEEEYLGEVANRYDGIYKGVSFSCTVHMFSDDEDKLRETIKAKNQRREGGSVRFDITFTLSFPSGKTRLITLLDVEFGNVETSDGARSDYVSMSFEGNCSETQSETL